MKENFSSKKINYHPLSVEKYVSDLKLVGSLSKIFSESETPFIHYRTTEIIYCASFGADNLARADVSVDARLRTNGIGIKTFIASSHVQKIAEFNKQQELYKDLSSLQKVKKISELRNSRLRFTLNAYGLEKLFYHCILRERKGFSLCEEEMSFIDVDKVKLAPNKKDRKALFFTDGIEEYKFDITKSTLYKKFKFEECFKFIPVDIFEDAIAELRKLKDEKKNEEIVFIESAIIPLYSESIAKGKFISEKGSLNQWNANGRARNCSEVYIPYNKNVRELYENFFPSRDIKFKVELPNGKIISMKICQSDGKAIMSDPNKDLGEWLLRDVLGLKEKELLTYEKLLEIGIDAVEFQKLGPLEYKIDFKAVGEFEKYRDSLDN